MTDDILAICRLIADDGYAISFQSMGQYRAALIGEIHRMTVPVESLGREHGE